MLIETLGIYIHIYVFSICTKIPKFWKKFKSDGPNNFKIFLNCIFANKECCGSKQKFDIFEKTCTFLC